MRNIHTIFWHAFLLCVSVSGMGIGGPGLQLFITVPLPSVMLVSSPPTATTFFSSRVGNVCYFVTPEGVNLFHTTILTRLSLSYSPHFSHREAWVCKKAKNPWMIAIYMLHSSVQRLEAVLNSPHGCAVLTPGQLQPPDSKERERCPPLCITYSQLCPLHSSCRQVFHFQGLKTGTAWPVATHFGETFILNQISNAKGDWIQCKRWFRRPLKYKHDQNLAAKPVVKTLILNRTVYHSKTVHLQVLERVYFWSLDCCETDF